MANGMNNSRELVHVTDCAMIFSSVCSLHESQLSKKPSNLTHENHARRSGHRDRVTVMSASIQEYHPLHQHCTSTTCNDSRTRPVLPCTSNSVMSASIQVYPPPHPALHINYSQPQSHTASHDKIYTSASGLKLNRMLTAASVSALVVKLCRASLGVTVEAFWST